MSRLNDLIKELCPNGVEYKKLEDCCNILDNKRTVYPGHGMPTTIEHEKRYNAYFTY